MVTGLMGVGKSTLADRIGGALGRPVRDSDRDIESTFGRPGAHLAAELGVPELHRIESAMLLGALAVSEPLVVAAAASVVEDARCREALARRARTIVLAAPTDTLVGRASESDHRRSMNAAEFDAVRDRRARFFDDVATVTIDATRAIDDVFAAAMLSLGQRGLVG